MVSIRERVFYRRIKNKEDATDFAQVLMHVLEKGRIAFCRIEVRRIPKDIHKGLFAGCVTSKDKAQKFLEELLLELENKDNKNDPIFGIIDAEEKTQPEVKIFRPRRSSAPKQRTKKSAISASA